MKNSEMMRKEVVVYGGSGGVEIEVLADANTVWLNRQQLAKLFGRDIKTIGKHIANALKEELRGFPVVAKFATTAADGKCYQGDEICSRHLDAAAQGESSSHRISCLTELERLVTSTIG